MGNVWQIQQKTCLLAKKCKGQALKHAYHPQLKTKIIRENNGQA